MSNLDEVIRELKSSIEAANDALSRSLSKIRSGKAQAEMLDSIRVDYYGVPTPVHQMATISVPEPRLITVKAWEKIQIKNIEKALRDSDLGLNPQLDGELIRLSIPALTEERRKESVKLTKKYGEERKVYIHKYLLEANEQIEQLLAESEISAEEATQARNTAQALEAAGIKHINELVAAKEKDILS